MKLLIIIIGHSFDPEWCYNIKQLKECMKNNKLEIDYCGISSNNDFHNYEPIINFKYKMVNSKRQLSKICDFITEYKSELNYDWYMKIRPDVRLLDTIAFDTLDKHAINARARIYNGPRRIEHGMSVNGEGRWKHVGDCLYSTYEHDIILDDQVYIFHNSVVKNNAFEKFLEPLFPEQELQHAQLFNKRKIPFNVIGINLCFVRNRSFSGHINMR
jgi:hypothetical protein